MRLDSRDGNVRNSVMGRALLVANLAICFASLSACGGKTDQSYPMSEMVTAIEESGAEAPQGHSAPVAEKTFNKIVDEAHCLSCHLPKNKVGAPTWKAVAKKYRKDTAAAAEAHLADKIAHGGSGVWGRVSMPPYPELSETDLKVTVQGILVAGETKPATHVNTAKTTKP